MYNAYIVVGALLALALTGSGFAKVTRNKTVVDNLTGIGVSLSLFPFLAACEFAGAAGLIIGIWWAPLGIAAAIGVVLYFVGAVGAHLRKSDFKSAPNAGVLLIVAAAALVFRLVSL
jgi:hypothetical protein